MSEPMEQRLSSLIDSRASDIEVQSKYYSGEYPRIVLPDRTLPTYASIVSQSRTPWASLVVDQAAERMCITGFRVITSDTADQDAEGDSLCWDIWQASQATMYSEVAFQTMLLHGLAFILVEDSTGLPSLSFEHPSTTATMSAPGGRATVSALKKWQQDETTDMAGLWTVGGGATALERSHGGTWAPSATQPYSTPAGMQQVPVFTMRNRPDLLGGYSSDLEGLYPTLDRVAQSIADRITTQLYASTKVRYLIGVEPEYDSDGNPTDATIKLATDRLLLIENPEAKAGVFDASDLRQFIEVTKSDISALAAIARLPTYLLSGDMVNVSREALESLSQGMVSRVEQRQTWASAALSEAMKYALALTGDPRADDPFLRVEPLWAPVLPPSLKDMADAASSLVGAGIVSPSGAQDLVLHLTPSERDKVAQYARADAITQQGVNVISSLFTAQQPQQQAQQQEQPTTPEPVG